MTKYKFRKIGILGYESPNSWTPIMVRTLLDMDKKEGRYIVTQYKISQIAKTYPPAQSNLLGKYKKPYSLWEAIFEHRDIDILFVSQSMWHYENDLQFWGIPVIYYHCELNSDLHMHSTNYKEDWSRACDFFAYKLPEIPNWVHQKSPWEMAKIPVKFYLPPCADPLYWGDPDKMEKDINVSLIGSPDDTFDMKYRDYYWNTMQTEIRKLKSWNDQTGFATYYPTPVNMGMYEKTLRRSEHMVIPANRGVYVGRRIFECFATKTIPILWVENEWCKQAFDDLGIDDRVAYFYHKPEDLKNMKLEYDPKMAQRGYDLLLDRHTPGHRVLKIIKEVEEHWDEIKNPHLMKWENGDENAKISKSNIQTSKGK